MKSPTFRHAEIFQVIVQIIKHAHRQSKTFISRGEIARLFRKDSYGKRLVKAAQRQKNRKGSLQHIAGNMVDWFSQKWTVKDPTWAWHSELFKRVRKGRQYWYAPKSSVEEDDVIREGIRTEVFVNRYERDKNARKRCINHYGAICNICSFSFSKFYGQFAERFIHVHHLRPLAEIQKEYIVDPIKDLRPVCPNCHAVLHMRTPPYTIREVRKFLRRRPAISRP